MKILNTKLAFATLLVVVIFFASVLAFAGKTSKGFYVISDDVVMVVNEPHADKWEELNDVGYRTHKKNGNIVMTFKKRVKVRVHTGGGPYVDTWGNKGDELTIRKGQWAQVWVLAPHGWVWAYAEDADNNK